MRQGVYAAFCSGIFTSNSTVYLAGYGGAAMTCTTTSAAGGMPITSAGVIKNLSVTFGTGGKAGDAVTLQKGGTDQSVSCTYNAATYCEDRTHSCHGPQ
jgi:hypothetical protein